MTDNFLSYKDYIKNCNELSMSFPSNDDSRFCYVIELIRRGKDHPELPAANYHFKNYYIFSLEQLNKYEEEIKTLCKTFGFRAYASVNYKDLQQVMLDTNAEMARRIALNDFKRPHAIFESCLGKNTPKASGRFIVDIDNIDINTKEGAEELHSVKEVINSCKSEYFESRQIIVKVFLTRSGLHIITRPFNLAEFREKCKAKGLPEYDVKKNHVTLLYEDL